MADQSFTVAARFVADDDGLSAHLKLTDKQLDQLTKSTKGQGAASASTAQKSAALASAQQRTAASTRRLRSETDSLSRAYSAAKTAIVGYISIQTLQQSIAIADSYKLQASKLRLVTDTAAEHSAVQEQLFQIALKTRTALASNVTMYQRIGASRHELGLAAGDILQFTENLQKLTKISGAESQEAKNAIIQLSQGLASGELRGEELRSVMEQLFAVSKTLGEALGADVGKLREMGEAGELTADKIVNAILSSTGKINSDFAKIDLLVSGAVQNFHTELTRYIGEADKASGASGAVASGIISVSQNLDTVATTAGLAGTVIATRYVAGALIPATVAMGRGAAMAGVYSIATQRLSVSMTAAALASRGLSASLAFFGGPIGATITAVAAGLYLLSTNTSEAEKATTDATTAVKGLSDQLEGGLIVSEKVASAKLNEALARRDNIAGMLEEARTAAQSKNALTELYDIFGIKTGAAERAEELEKSLEANAKNIEKIRARISAGFKTPGSQGTGRNEDAEELIDQMRREESQLLRLVDARRFDLETMNFMKASIDAENAARKAGLTAQDAQYLTVIKLGLAQYELRQQIEALNEADSKHEQVTKAVTSAYEEMQQASRGAVDNLKAWRIEAMAGLDATKPGYEEFAAQVEEIYTSRLPAARDEDLRSSRHWRDGVSRAIKDYVDEATDGAKNFENVTTTALKTSEDGFVKLARTGKLEMSDMFNTMADEAIRAFYRINIAKPAGSIFESLFSTVGLSLFGSPAGNSAGLAPAYQSVQIAHSGTIIGSEPTATRAVDPALFNSARKHHLGSRERPVIVEEDEGIFTPRQMDNADNLFKAAMAAPKFTVNVYENTGNARVRVEQNQTADGGFSIDVMIDEVEERISQRMQNGEGLSTFFESQYGANRASGVYR